MLRNILTNEKGVSLVLLALSVVVLFGFGAVAIDIGHLYNVKNQLQAAADAAALAGCAKLQRDANDLLPDCPARQAAFKVACMNYADVANDTVPGCTDGPAGMTSPDVNPGEPIPVALRHLQDQDIEVGNWSSGSGFTRGGTPINAVRVTTRRDNTEPYTPMAQNWFAKIFKLIDVNYDVTAITATAIAAREPAKMLPIAVNEYWDEGQWKYGAYPVGEPWDQHYPQSFMRAVNVDGTTGFGGKTFAIVGARANINKDAGMNVNSYVDVLHRCRFHNCSSVTIPSAWWDVKQDSTTGTCSTCENNLTEMPGTTKPGDVNSTKYDEIYSWLFKGIPDNVIPPNAVREIYRSPEHYPDNNYNNYTSFNDPQFHPDNCPYASIASFSSSGNIPELPHGPNGMRFSDQWPKGTRFIVMVYDGTHWHDYLGADVVTVVGYGVIEIDGYKNDPWDPSKVKKRDLDPSGGTAYGHAVPHNMTGVDPTVADVSDTYLIQPPLYPANNSPSSARRGSCKFTEIIRQLQSDFYTVHLVDPNVKYGMAH